MGIKLASQLLTKVHTKKDDRYSNAAPHSHENQHIQEGTEPEEWKKKTKILKNKKIPSKEQRREWQ
eukprot:8095146-Ditylum_brightwellii.AAC.1